MLEWVDKQNGVDDILAEDVNMLAHAIKYSENKIDRLDVQIGNIDTALDNIIEIQNTLIGGGTV